MEDRCRGLIIPSTTHNIYVLSGFFYWILAAALFYKKGAKYKYGLPLYIFVLFQPFFTYMGDCYELTSDTCCWNTADRAWAVTGVLTSILFIWSNQFACCGEKMYYIGMGAGLGCWLMGVYLYRTNWEYSKYWSTAHILWHTIPIVGGVGTILTLY